VGAGDGKKVWSVIQTDALRKRAGAKEVDWSDERLVDTPCAPDVQLWCARRHLMPCRVFSLHILFYCNIRHM
jgi:hypothetical protein